MATATERVPVLMTTAEKRRLAAAAKRTGITMSEYLRRAAADYRPREDVRALEAMIDEMNKATERAEAAIEDALKFVSASNQRIAAMEAEAKAERSAH